MDKKIAIREVVFNMVLTTLEKYYADLKDRAGWHFKKYTELEDESSEEANKQKAKHQKMYERFNKEAREVDDVRFELKVEASAD